MGMHESGGRMSDFGHKRRGGWKHAGFTLGEVLVVMAIIAILSAVAYPSYLSYITRANRAAAQGFMLEVSNRQERYLLDKRAYATVIDSTGLNVTIPKSVSDNYTVTTNSPSARAGAPSPSYDVVADPKPGQAARDAACGKLTIDETGHKSVAGTAGTSSCWRD
jgi:type IV pilus assembly protein PilE